MTQEHEIAFGPFRPEPPPGRLWRDDHMIPLRPHSLTPSLNLSHFVARKIWLRR